MKIAVLLPNWIGDVVMATPTLRALRNHFSDSAQIVGIMKPYVARVLEGTTWLDETEWFDRKSKDPALRTRSLIQRLRRHAPDTIVLLTNSFRGAAIARLAGIPERVGYARYHRGWLLTHPIQPPKSNGKFRPISAIDYYLQLAYEIGCSTESVQMELATTSKDEAVVDQIWNRFGFDRLQKVYVFNTGGAYGSAKHWPTENYIELAHKLVDRASDCGVLVICGPAEKDTAKWIEESVSHPRVKSMANEDLSLGVAKACVRRSQMMVTTDSGPRHFAPAFDVPVVALFGPIDPRWSDSHFPFAINLTHQIDCSPCGKRSCPLGHHKCMRDLSVNRVVASIDELHGRITERKAA